MASAAQGMRLQPPCAVLRTKGIKDTKLTAARTMQRGNKSQLQEEGYKKELAGRVSRMNVFFFHG